METGNWSITYMREDGVFDVIIYPNCSRGEFIDKAVSDGFTVRERTGELPRIDGLAGPFFADEMHNYEHQGLQRGGGD